eukprot:scaffold5688_cov116-Isochrysis_galbana.AAC.13
MLRERLTSYAESPRSSVSAMRFREAKRAERDMTRRRTLPATRARAMGRLSRQPPEDSRLFRPA